MSRNDSPDLNVRSIMSPDLMFFNFRRITAPPLPGLWCWNQTTCQMRLSHSKMVPFLNSLVEIMIASTAPYIYVVCCVCGHHGENDTRMRSSTIPAINTHEIAGILPYG